MADLGVNRWIRELDENGAVGLARSLIFAEAGRHGLPLEGFSMSGRVKARDQGIDGRTNFPDHEGLLLPRGPQVWQVKSGSTAPSATDEIHADNHAALRDAIQDGHGYVLVWTNDPVDPNSTAVQEGFEDAVRSVRADGTTSFLFAEQLERLCLAHPGVLAQQSPIPVADVVGIDVWATDEFSQIAFQHDTERTAYIEMLRSHVASSELPAEIHIYGDTGVGKSRLVYEALSPPGIKERVLVVPDASRWDSALLTLVAQADERGLVLVIDDCDADYRSNLTKYTGLARGRVRLITIGSRYDRERRASDQRYLELGPLSASASRDIALLRGLSQEDASTVAELTEGYPGLALRLADTIRFGSPDDTLIQRIRGHEEIGAVFTSLLPPEDESPLGLLAMFEKLGFEGDLAPEVTLACEVFGMDEQALRRIAERELNRFVSAAGRFRRVTPKLFAIWLGSKFMQDAGEGLGEALLQLPESLRDRILAQMAEFAGDERVAKAIAVILVRPPFSSGALGDVSEGAARILHVAAVAAPGVAIDAIERVMGDMDTEDLRQIVAGRRELVWALEILLWHDQYFDRTADTLLRLAMAENEDWANNATGVVQEAFQVFLGGTAAPHVRRVAWARAAVERFGQPAVPIIVGGLEHAFDAYEGRSVTHLGRRAVPREWRPTLVADEVEARAAAWDLLMELAQGFPESRSRIAEAVANGLRTAVGRGLADRVSTDLTAIEWSPDQRGTIGEAVALTLKYEDLPDEIAVNLQHLESQLQGYAIADRLDFALALEPWQLTRSESPESIDRPAFLETLAEELVASGLDAIVDAAHRSVGRRVRTTTVLFAAIGRKSEDPEILPALEELPTVPGAALLGLLRGLASSREPEWADRALVRWSEGRLAALLVDAVHSLSATDSRARLAIDAVDKGDVEASELGRLLYGAWTRPLTAETVAEVLSRLLDVDSDDALEHGLGILDQWLDGSTSPPLDAIKEVGRQFLTVASTSESLERSSMVSLHRSRLIGRLGLPFNERLQTTLAALRTSSSFPDSQDVESLIELARERFDDAVNAVQRLVLGDDQYGNDNLSLMWIEHARLLSSVLAVAPDRSAAADGVLRSVSIDRWPSLLGHIDFGTDEPEPIVLKMLSSSDDQRLRSGAFFRFIYPQSAWTGPESEYLRERREVARRWRDAPDATDVFRGWIDEVLNAIDHRVADVGREEEERGF